MLPHAKRALVTGGAGLIGSHIVDLLLTNGWQVRILDNLEPNTHKFGKPAWVNPRAEFLQGEVQNYDTMLAALTDIDVVFHEAAYGGYMPEMAKYVLVNSFGTAQLLEIIRDHKLPIRKVVVASSQAVYSEGAALCPEHGPVVPLLRPAEQLRAGDFAVHCPVLMGGEPCGKPTTSIPTPEATPGGGETVYALTKVDQERLVLLWGKQTGIPTAALRYSCTYGPRQSLFNPYTGVIAIFCTRLLNNQPPVLYEDGGQTRDLCFVEDIARANLLVATTDKLDGLPVNVGSGRATSVRSLAGIIAGSTRHRHCTAGPRRVPSRRDPLAHLRYFAHPQHRLRAQRHAGARHRALHCVDQDTRLGRRLFFQSRGRPARQRHRAKRAKLVRCVYFILRLPYPLTKSRQRRTNDRQLRRFWPRQKDDLAKKSNT